MGMGELACTRMKNVSPKQSHETDLLARNAKVNYACAKGEEYMQERTAAAGGMRARARP